MDKWLESGRTIEKTDSEGKNDEKNALISDGLTFDANQIRLEASISTELRHKETKDHLREEWNNWML